MWDGALEEMLSRPITPDLRHEKVRWKSKTTLGEQFIPATMPNTPKSSIARSIKSQAGNERSKTLELRQKEVRIHNIITAPLSPRKKTVIKKSVYRHQHDQRHVENALKRKYESKSYDTMDAPLRKIENPRVARMFTIPTTLGANKFRFS